MATQPAELHESGEAGIFRLRVVGLASSFLLAFMAGLALTTTAYVESFHSARLAVVYLLIILFHLMRFQRFYVTREALIYGSLFGYMLLQLIWAPDLRLAMNTVVPAASCVLTYILFGSLIRYHDRRAVLGGIFFGFAAGALLYTLTTGFPLRYPSEFSYNAIASMYLFGLISALFLGCYIRSTIPILLVALVVLLHIVATTSIKNNLGIVLGAGGASLIYLKGFTQIIRRHSTLLLVVSGLAGIFLVRNPLILDALQRGSDRIILGLKVLQAREDLPGYNALGRRSEWQSDGLSGWLQNPVFGHGPEAFRSEFGITSHSTYVDLLYNSGVIGLVLYYGIFVSVALRLRSAARDDSRNLLMLVFAGLICYAFVSFSGMLHYSSAFAAFIALSVGLLSERKVGMVK